MKILQLGKFYPVLGGVEKVMFDITKGLSDEGVECDMMCATSDGRGSEVIELNGNGRIFRCRTWTKKAGTTIAPSMITELRRRAKEYDLIHIHHPDPMAAVALLLSGYKGKVVLHWHSDIISQKLLLNFTVRFRAGSSRERLPSSGHHRSISRNRHSFKRFRTRPAAFRSE